VPYFLIPGTKGIVKTETIHHFSSTPPPPAPNEQLKTVREGIRSCSLSKPLNIKRKRPPPSTSRPPWPHPKSWQNNAPGKVFPSRGFSPKLANLHPPPYTTPHAPRGAEAKPTYGGAPLAQGKPARLRAFFLKIGDGDLDPKTNGPAKPPFSNFSPFPARQFPQKTPGGVSSPDTPQSAH